MNRLFLPLNRMLAIAVAGISFASLLIPQPSFAEPSSNILQNLNPQDDNPLSPRSDEVNNMNVFNLIHRAQLSSDPWNVEQGNQEINDAAAAFKARQQQMFQQQRQLPTNARLQLNTPQVGH